MNNGYLGMVRQWQTLFYNNRLSAVELDCFPDAEKLAGGVRLQGQDDRQALGAGAGAGSGGQRAGPVPAQREGDAVRMCVPDGAGRRRHSRDGVWGRPNRWKCRHSEDYQHAASDIPTSGE